MKSRKDKKYSREHFIKRMYERYKKKISDHDYNKLCKIIEKIEIDPISVENQKDDIQKVYRIFYYTEYIKVVWSDKRKCLTTVLP